MRDEPTNLVDVQAPLRGAWPIDVTSPGLLPPSSVFSSLAHPVVDVQQPQPVHQSDSPRTAPKASDSRTLAGTDFPRGLALVSSNKNKVAEFESLLGFKLASVSMQLPEVQSLDVKHVALRKAELAFSLVRRPVLVDDTGIYIDAWHGLPGAFTGWFFNTVGSEGMLQMLQQSDNRSATAVTALAVCDADGSRVCVGEATGHVAEQVQGDVADGHNAIWIPDGENQTAATMPQGHRDRVSSRAAAVAALKRQEWVEDI